MATSALGRLLAQQQLIICVGAGGVGKTTTAAALAVAAALSGRSTAVITIDPARRLRDALGLPELASEPQAVPLGAAAAPLAAMALDTKRAFDRLITRVAPTPAVAERIFANRLYQELSSELGGASEYMAMERLHELLAVGEYDLLVVDTPPSADLRALLTAPRRMTDLLASQAVRFLKAPRAIAARPDSALARATVAAVLRALERWTGLDLLRDLGEFAAAFEELLDGFRQRAARMAATLRAEETSFAIVTTPEAGPITTALGFASELHRGGYPVGGFIANRVHDFPPLDAGAGSWAAPPLRAKLLANYADLAALSRRDAAALARLSGRASAPLIAQIPMLTEAPAAPAALCALAARLLGGGARVRPASVGAAKRGA